MDERVKDNIAASGAYWDRANVAPAEDVRYWLGVLSVRRAINRRMTGDPEKLYIQAFLDSLRLSWPIPRVLSVGCGTGDLERGVAGQGAARQVDGVDVSEASIAVASRFAAEAGLSDRISYHLDDAATFMRSQLGQGRRYDLVFFHGSLHHLEALETVLDLTVEILRGGSPGWVYVDEYMGPSRHEWTDAHLEAAQELFSRIPSDARRTPAVWPPIAMEDPTEMIRSSEILPLLRERFEILDEKPYYGNVLAPLVCAVLGSALDRPDIQEILGEALAIEEKMATEGVPSLYTALVAKPR